MTTPRIYVACLAAYNAGRLHGRWIDATQSAEEIADEVREMLEASPENRTCQWCGAELIDDGERERWNGECTHREHWLGHAEEWAIHDYEGFEGVRLSEWESFERVAAIAAGIAANGPAFAAWLGYDDSRDPDDTAAFDEEYRGEWDSMRDYAEQFAEDMGLFDAAEKAASPYVTVDLDALARDLEIELWTAPAESFGVYVFYPR